MQHQIFGIVFDIDKCCVLHQAVLPNALQIAKPKMSAATIVGPTGVPARTDTKRPSTAPKTENMQAKIVTFLKLFRNCIAEVAGKIIKAEIKREPTRFIASTMITATNVAIMIL